MIKELTRRLREADAMIEHLQSQHKPLQTQQTNTQLELSNALAGEAQVHCCASLMLALVSIDSFFGTFGYFLLRHYCRL